MRLKHTFTKMFLYLLNNFTICYNTNKNSGTAMSIFDFKKYLSFFDKSTDLHFMKEFTKTQLFTSFIEKAYSSNNESNELAYFLKSKKLIEDKSGNKLSLQLKQLTEELRTKYKKVKNRIKNIIAFAN